MRRKYDIRNKRNFIIILVIAIIIIGIFSLFIYKYKQAGKIAYNIKTGSILQDDKKNYFNIDEDAVLKVRWNGNYYLIYQDKKIGLGKKVMVFDTITNAMKLYGKYHEIQEDGKIVEIKDETTLANTSDTKFYKLDDREYLLIDRLITSSDKSIDASNYLLVELDRMGNAKLSNYKLNLKTINPTTLLTSKYSFDIANEILKYNKLEIDLKKIIGTTNQYKPEPEKKKTDEEPVQQPQQNTVVADATGNNQVVNDNTGGGEEETSIEEIIAKTKATSIIRISEGLTQVDVDYVVFDPYSEYKSVYATIVKNGVAENIKMSATDTHMIFSGLNPDTAYNVKFYYTTIDKETKETVTTKFEEVTVRTKKPAYRVAINMISGIKKNITYKVYLQEGYNISKINMSFSFKYNDTDEDGNPVVRNKTLYKELIVNGGDKVALDLSEGFSFSGYDIVPNSLARISVDSVVGSNGTIEIGSYFPFEIGG